MIGQVTVAAATAVVGYDLLKDTQFNMSSRKRALDGVALGGSAVAGDCSVDLFIDSFYVGRFYNTVLSWPTRDHVQPLPGLYVPPGAKLTAKMVTQPTTNAINLILYGRG